MDKRQDTEELQLAPCGNNSEQLRPQKKKDNEGEWWTSTVIFMSCYQDRQK